MCGIIGVVRRRSERIPPATTTVVALLESARGAAERLAEGPGLVEMLDAVSGPMAEVDAALRGATGITALLDEPGLPSAVGALVADIDAAVRDLDARLDIQGTVRSEAVNAALVRALDLTWAIGRDRLRTADAVRALAGSAAGAATVEVYASIQIALSALDRLEVRGRDSAGLHVFVTGHGLDLAAAPTAALLAERIADPLFRSGAVRVEKNGVSFVYKAAAEIGELGDNTAALRAAIAADDLLRAAVASPDAEAVVLGHTRWASVGIISEANAHPLNSDQVELGERPYVTAALNGDVDNFADLEVAEGLRIPPAITTDAKVIPTMVSARLGGGVDADEAFRATVTQFEGSVAIAAHLAVEENRLHLALRGSGQALYVGLADDAFVVASEPYGVIEETDRYLRLDGETPADPANPVVSRGQIVVLDGARAGEIDGIVRRSYDGRPLPVGADEIVEAEITTRDIDRGDHPHFLLKELSESPVSFRKTLRGRLVERDGELSVDLSGGVPEAVAADLADGTIEEVLVIGQGTAAVAGQSLARFLTRQVGERSLRVRALPATELSGFGLRDDMSDTLVVAISQSGTTTDTNRTVDVVRARGARVLAIVNRRGSDLTDRADGVIYTSDGRDVEMSVASTKAFYAQIAAGILLACAIADHRGVDPAAAAGRAELLAGLRALPEAMDLVLAARTEIAAAARRNCPSRRYWAIVGNGANRIAAEEIRIKLSELCYKSIASDATEDKKHIDLSSEPMILVCAAGLEGSTADDVAKEVAIYAAHKAAPVVIANGRQRRFSTAIDVIEVPAVHPELSFVLSTMAGHLFGYEAALAIDDQARPLRESRAAIERLVAEGVGGEDLFQRLRTELDQPARTFFDGLRDEAYDGHLEASTAARLATGYRYALAMIPLDAYQLDRGKVGTPGVVVEDLSAALSAAIDELTRPIDAIKHQAKTVTVGISRTDETLLQAELVKAVLAAGAPRDSLSYRTLRTLAALDPAVTTVAGHTRYRVEGDPSDTARLVVADRGGISTGMASRVDTDPTLRGTKRQVAVDQEVLVTMGRRDGRSILIVPEVKGGLTTELTLLHVQLADEVDAATARGVLQGYGSRYTRLRDAVTETEPRFDDRLLGEIPLAALLVGPVTALADYWRS